MKKLKIAATIFGFSIAAAVFFLSVMSLTFYILESFERFKLQQPTSHVASREWI